MTRDQKQVLKALGAFVGFKTALFFSIRYASKTAREAIKTYSA